MKILITENTIEKIQNLISVNGVFNTANMFGGVKRFIDVINNIPELKYVLNDLKGSCGVSHSQYPEAMFDFIILDIHRQDEHFGELTVDMLVDFSNLSGEEIYSLKQWMGVVADDLGFETYDLDVTFPTHVNLVIKSFNGKPYSWPGWEDVISDEEAFELLDKTGLWEGLIRESIHVFKNEKTDDNHSFKTMVAVINRLEDKPGNSFTDYSDLDPTLKIKYLESEERGIVVYIDTESLGVSDEEFEVFTNYGDETRRHMTNRNVMKFWHGYKLNDDEDDTHPPFKRIIYKRLEKLRNIIGLKDKLLLTILP